jgi:hypothetical protein
LWLKGTDRIDWDLVEPGVHWIIFSQMFGRFDDDVVKRWDDLVVEVDHQFVPMSQARSLERKALGDTLRYEVALGAFEDAVRDAAVAWAASLGLLRTRVNESKEVVIVPTGDGVPITLLDVTKPLRQRDEALFDWLPEGLTKSISKPFPMSIYITHYPSSGRLLTVMPDTAAIRRVRAGMRRPALKPRTRRKISNFPCRLTPYSSGRLASGHVGNSVIARCE